MTDKTTSAMTLEEYNEYLDLIKEEKSLKYQLAKVRAKLAGYEIRERVIDDSLKRKELTIVIDHETECYVLDDGWFGVFRNGRPIWGNGQRANIDVEIARKMCPIVLGFEYEK